LRLNSIQSKRTGSVTCHHKVLAATERRCTGPALTPARQAGT